jgi:hypothetical protein
MSSKAQRQMAIIAKLPDLPVPSLVRRLRAAGIKIPDQEQAALSMERHRLGYRNEVSEWWLRWTYRRLLFSSWTVFDYDQYHANAERYGGGPVPASVKRIADRIREVAPDAQLRVHAKHTDPWLTVTEDFEELIVTGWLWEYDYQAGESRELILL